MSYTVRNVGPCGNLRALQLCMVFLLGISLVGLAHWNHILLLSSSSSSSAAQVNGIFTMDHCPPHAAATKNAEMLSCLQEVLFDYLPVDKNNRLHAHHHDARNGKWNQDIRLEPMPLNNHCTVWEVGAHKTASDTKEFLKTYPNCTYHAFEPIPQFHQNLERVWSNEPRVVTHNYGIGGSNSTFMVSLSDLKRQSTYIGDSENGNIPAHIYTFETAVANAGGLHPTLLHVNCEGCEWTMFPEAKQAGFLDTIPIIQFGTHNYGKVGVGVRAWQLCEIRGMLNETHEMIKGVPFGWERWTKRDMQ